MSIARVVCLCALSLIGSSSSAFAQTGRKPPPAEDQLKAATALIADIYKKDLAAAKTAPQKRVLAKKMLDDAANTRDDAAAKYALCVAARKLAQDSGDVEVAFQAISVLEKEFDIDASNERKTLLAELAADVKDPAIAYDLLVYIHQSQMASLAADRPEAAAELNSALTKCGARLADADLRKQIEVRSAEIAEIVAAWKQHQATAEKLKTAPDDPAANLNAGRYQLLKGEWSKAIPLLALSGDAALQNLGESELQGGSQAQEAAALAEAWWKLAADRKGWEKSQLQSRAIHHIKARWTAFAPLVKTKFAGYLDQFARDNEQSIARWNAFYWTNATPYPWHVTLDGRRGEASLTTVQNFSGPLDIQVLARTDANNIRVAAYGKAEVIWNWERNRDELRVHRPDGSIAAKGGTALTIDRFHALRFAVKSDTIAASTNRTVVFTERGKYDLPSAPVRVYSPDSTVDVRSVGIKTP
jgi:hypothetical protein